MLPLLSLLPQALQQSPTSTLCLLAASITLLLALRKALPLSYHLRAGLSLLLRCTLLALRGHGFKTPGEAYSTRHSVTLGDLDWQGHQNNAVYNSELDVQRYGFLTELLGGLRPLDFPLFKHGWKLANGGVSMHFLREMRLGQRYSLTTRVLSIDKKWLYVESRFTTLPGAQRPVLFAVALSRLVFKEASKRTVPPAEALAKLGYAEQSIAELAAKAPTLPLTPAQVGPTFSAMVEVLCPEAAAASTPKPKAG